MKSVDASACDPAAAMPTPKLFYVQDTRQLVGNALLWWRKGGQGYGCNLDEAEVFTEHAARQLIKSSGYKYRAWPKEYIDARVIKAIDFQHLETDQAMPPPPDKQW